jgi:hypothetical protein
MSWNYWDAGRDDMIIIEQMCSDDNPWSPAVVPVSWEDRKLEKIR